MFISEAFAQTAGAPGGGSIITALLPWIFIILIFYFLLIRPQQKRLKAHQAMVHAVKRGDTAVTAGGIVGKVTKVGDNEITVEIADKVRVQVIKSTLSDVRVKGEPAG
jgi:preprotein translocase subunit YajC